ncbi:MAG TPA: type IV pilus assembly protein PilM [Microterricola sp.]
MAKSVVGVDITSTAVRAVEVGDPGRGKATVLRHFEIALPEGAVSRGEVIETNTVAQALKQLWARGGFKSKDIVLGMGNQRVLARDLTVPKASLRRIRESLPFEVHDMLPVPVADALLDFYPVSEGEGEHGPVVHGLLIAAVKAAVLGNVAATQKAGLNTVDVDLIPFALTRALISRPGIAGTAALVDIGANTTTVVIVRDGVPQFVRIIPTGGDDITIALRSGLETDTAGAEGVKRSLGLASSVASREEQAAVEVIYRVALEQLSSLRNTISYFVNTRPEDPVQQIVLSGGGAQLPGLVNALGEMTRLPVVLGDPFSSVSIARSADEEQLRQRGSTFTVALGLALGSAA